MRTRTFCCGPGEVDDTINDANRKQATELQRRGQRIAQIDLHPEVLMAACAGPSEVYVVVTLIYRGHHA